eukprot:3247079-Pyramimonas_sp.AAC.1
MRRRRTSASNAVKEEPAADGQNGSDVATQLCRGGGDPPPPKRSKYDGIRNRVTSAARLADSLGSLLAEDGVGEAGQGLEPVVEGPQLLSRAQGQLLDVASLLPTDATWVANASDDLPATVAKRVA